MANWHWAHVNRQASDVLWGTEQATYVTAKVQPHSRKRRTFLARGTTYPAHHSKEAGRTSGKHVERALELALAARLPVLAERARRRRWPVSQLEAARMAVGRQAPMAGATEAACNTQLVLSQGAEHCKIVRAAGDTCEPLKEEGNLTLCLKSQQAECAVVENSDWSMTECNALQKQSVAGTWRQTGGSAA